MVLEDDVAGVQGTQQGGDQHSIDLLILDGLPGYLCLVDSFLSEANIHVLCTELVVQVLL